MTGKTPFVTVVIPTLNEERFILPLLESLGCLGGNRCLPYPHEVVVVDGGSTDRTLDILAGLGQENGIRVIHNPAIIQSAGVNLAAKEADPQSRFMVRVDAHAVYAHGFVETVVQALLDTGAPSVVVPLITHPQDAENSFIWAVTVAQRSKLGNGGSAHRLEATPAMWVDHGHHAGFDIEFFKALGGYDEAFATNEDAEYDVRVAKSGGRIWFEPRAKAWYSPRATVKALARQYFRYGIGRASTILKHRLVPMPRQMFPLVALMANFCGLAAGLFWPLFLLIPATYVSACLLAARKEALAMSRPSGLTDLSQAALALVVMHMSWALGFACKIAKSVDIIVGRRN